MFGSGNLPYIYKSETSGTKTVIAQAVPPRVISKPYPHPLFTDWLRLIQPAREASGPARQGRGPARPGEARVPSPDQTSLHTFTTLTDR